MSRTFKDRFSEHATQYQIARPDYPQELFQQLADLAPSKACAWDCATGNGQAALALARHFTDVYASDASFAQINQASRHKGVHYCVATGEASAVAGDTFDLIVVAQALHWFDIDKFITEARRVLKKDGLLAVWCYQRMTINLAIDEIIMSYYTHTVGPYWPGERKYVENGYSNIEIPLVEQKLPPFVIEKHWDLQQVSAYVRSWSATQRYMREHHKDPVVALTETLRQVWGCTSNKHRVHWPLAVRAGGLMG
jgi:SAM-dependent methyltransferase